MDSTHSEFQVVEDVPASLVSLEWKNFAILHGTTMGFYCIAIGFLASTDGWRAAIAWFALSACVATAIVAGITMAHHRKIKKHLPTVAVRDDRIVVKFGDDEQTEPLSECDFRHGRCVSDESSSWRAILLCGACDSDYATARFIQPTTDCRRGWILG